MSRSASSVAWGQAGLGLLALAGAAWVWGRLTGVHPLAFVLGLQVLLMWWALFLLHVVRPGLRGGWYVVRPWETGLYRRLGVPAFGRLLRAVGWERARRGARGFGGTRASLARLDRATREAEYSHLGLALICVGLGVVFVARRAPDTALWLLLTTVPVHLYPAMLQRTLRGRLQRLGIRG